jgi:TRAP transporter 4TM/12TM fusion protein
MAANEHLDLDAHELAASSETGARHKSGGFSGFLIALVAGSWSTFQMLLPQAILLNSEFVRAIHLAFAIALVYLSFPFLKATSKRLAKFREDKKKGRLSWWKRLFFDPDQISPLDFLCATVAALSALYLVFDYEGIGARQGMPITRDIVIGVTLIVLLLEAARRALGPALPVIASLFILYSFNSESMPAVLAFKDASLSKVVNKLTMGTEGIYGIPLDVSASTVFLFVLFGAMLDKAGGGKYFIDLAFSLLGRFRGGPAKAAVLASGLTGMVSGSSIANTVTTGTFTIPLMKRAGYPGVKAGAIEVASSTNGQIMPPIMGAAAFIIAEYCQMSYFEVVRSAFIPAVASYLSLIFITHLEASKLGLKGLSKDQLPPFLKTLVKGAHFLIPLIILLYQLIIVRHSAQLSVYYAVLILGALMVIRNFVFAKEEKRTPFQTVTYSVKELWGCLVQGGRNMMSIGVAVAAAGIIVGIVTLGLGGAIIEVIGALAGGNIVALLFITAIVSLILGMGLPTTANYIVMASLTAPAIIVLSGEAGLVVPLIAAHLFCFYFGILADDTPPVGLAAYAAAAISKENPIQTGVQGFIYDMRTAILPFMFIFNTDLLLIGITNPVQIMVIFGTAVLAMFAFASMTQGFFVVKNRFYETIAFGGICFLLLRPYVLADYLQSHKYVSYAVGLGIYVTIYLTQKWRQPQALPEARESSC